MKKLILALIGLICLVAAEPNVLGGAVASLTPPGLSTMEHPELLPLFLPDGMETRQSSSYDPSGSNNDGNFRTAYTKYIDTNGEYVIFDASGPGCPSASTLLTSPISCCARYLGALEAPRSGSFTLYVSDSKPHQLALYVCDFDKAGREETIELLDLAGRALTPACKVSGFEQGKWLRFRFSGNIQIRLNNQRNSSTAVLSALMFDKNP